MIIGFIIWSAVALVLAGIGIWSWNSKKAAGFYAGVNPPEVKDIKKYNHAVGTIWFVYAALFELLGLPILVLKRNSAGFIGMTLGIVAISIGLAVAYNFVLEKHRKK